MPGGSSQPVVDLSALMKALETGGAEDTVNIAQNQPEVGNLARLMLQTLSKTGFCYLCNHGLPQSAVDRAFSAAKKFFEQSEDVKKKYGRGPGDCHGWSGVGLEMLLNDRKYGDLKESFNFSPYDLEMMPVEVPDMEPSFQDLFRKCHVLVCRLLDLLGVALELEDPSTMSTSHQLAGTKDSFSTLRCLRYPTDVPLKEGQLSCGEHTDYGCVTLIFQDQVGGLQAKGDNGEYHDVPAIPGTIVLQLADLMQRWTANRLPATSHRVVLPADAATRGRSRFSVIYYAIPDNDKLIRCLDGSDTYPPVTAADYLTNMLSRTSY